MTGHRRYGTALFRKSQILPASPRLILARFYANKHYPRIRTNPT